jgi:hypothetical protein
MKFVVLLLLCVTSPLVACKSSGNDAARVAAERCICGTPEADFEGCPHPLCLKGERNPDNPDCVCGPMKMGGKK